MSIIYECNIILQTTDKIVYKYDGRMEYFSGKKKTKEKGQLKQQSRFTFVHACSYIYTWSRVKIREYVASCVFDDIYYYM